LHIIKTRVWMLQDSWMLSGSVRALFSMTAQDKGKSKGGIFTNH